MRLMLFLIAIVYMWQNFFIQCSQNHVKDQEGWYQENPLAQKVQNQKDNPQKASDKTPYQKLLSVQRQIIMSQEIIKLYQQRLILLKQIEKQVKKQLLQHNFHIKSDINSSTYNPNQIDLNDNDSKINPDFPQNHKLQAKNQPNNHQKNSQDASYVSLNQYNFDVSSLEQKNGFQSWKEIPDLLVLVPPFAINKAKSYVSLIQASNNPQNTKKRYDFAQSSNRLLFYSVEKNPEEDKWAKQQTTESKSRKFVLNLALQIKPNKIKSVKMTYHPSRFSNRQSWKDQFQVEQVITSYESNQLISQNYKWHKALEFQNQIIGFENKKVYIKGKDKKMNEIDVGSNVLSIHSLNQFKILYVAQDKIGSINVISFLKSDQIKFQHYLGNMTLIKQKQLLKSYSNKRQIQEQSLYDSFKPEFYWSSPFKLQFSSLRAVSVLYLQQQKKILILLSNGDLLLHQNNKITGHVNLGHHLIKNFNFDSLFKEFPDPSSDETQQLSKIRIKMDLLPSFKYLLITSNIYSKILIFNITIPLLTQINYGSGISFFSSSSRSTEFACKYWRVLQVGDQKNHEKCSKQNFRNYPIQFFVDSQTHKQFQLQMTKKPSDFNEKAIYFYHSHYLKQKREGQTDQANQEHNQSNNQSRSVQISYQTIRISEYRLLLNLIDGGHDFVKPTSSEGRSYLWNIFMVVIIGLGVLIFRKCKQRPSESKSQWDDQLTQQLNKGKNFPSNANSSQQRLKSKPTTKLDQMPQRKPTTKTKIQFDNMVISELQKYLEKQGQQLSKQEIAYMVRQMQQNQNQQVIKKTQMKRQQTTQSNSQDEQILLENNNSTTNDEKLKKKPNPQDKSKRQQNFKRKKQ